MLDTLPLHAYDLIDDLAQRYPEVLYDPSLPHDEFLLRSGERRLVVALIRKRQLEREEPHVHQ